MVFSSFLFLFAFLPLFLIAYYGAPRNWKNGVALVASLLFYLWGAPQAVPVLLLSTVVDYRIAQLLIRKSASQRERRFLLGLGCGANVMILAYAKYTNFFIAQWANMAPHFGLPALEWGHVLLPVGISFFTFHKISYLVDVYRTVARPAARYFDYLLYVLLFPQLVAGPIIRYADVAEELRVRTHSLDLFFDGIWRFALGLARKVLIADTLGAVADNAFGALPTGLPPSYAWLGMVCYAFQIYHDFAGYSDMAIGLGKMMGLTFRENFNHPYGARSITEFWRRWHISLSTWMREYLYIPLGGNRVGSIRAVLNLWIVFLLSGLWHGASWNFVFWGMYHGFFLTLDRFGLQAILEKLPVMISRSFTFLCICIGWILFRADSLSAALHYYERMLSRGMEGNSALVFRAQFINSRATAMLCVALTLPLVITLGRQALSKIEHYETRAPLVAAQGLSAILLVFLSAAALATSGFTPFLYFRF